ncbi:MAG: hypothetical protein ACI4D8_03415 [Wujia sp.]
MISNNSLAKYIITACTTVLLCIVLCSCSVKPKNFTVDELTITLNNNFMESKKDGFTVYITSEDVVFSAVKEETDALEYAGYEISSLKDYSYEIANLNSTPSSALVDKGNYYYFTNSKTVSGAKYTYVHCMFKGENAYWVCEFVCKSKNYDKYKDVIFKWADTIEIK